MNNIQVYVNNHPHTLSELNEEMVRSGLIAAAHVTEEPFGVDIVVAEVNIDNALGKLIVKSEIQVGDKKLDMYEVQVRDINFYLADDKNALCKKALELASVENNKIIDALNANIAELDSNLNNKNSELDALNKSNQQITSLIDKENKITSIRKIISDARGKIDVIERNNKKGDMTAKIKNELDTLQNKIEAKNKELKKIHEEITYAQDLHTQSEGTLQTLRAKNGQ